MEESIGDLFVTFHVDLVLSLDEMRKRPIIILAAATYRIRLLSGIGTGQGGLDPLLAILGVLQRLVNKYCSYTRQRATP